jgi:hypothetical protein
MRHAKRESNGGSPKTHEKEKPVPTKGSKQRRHELYLQKVKTREAIVAARDAYQVYKDVQANMQVEQAKLRELKLKYARH